MKHYRHLIDNDWRESREEQDDVSSHIRSVMIKMWGEKITNDKLREFAMIEKAGEEDNDKNIHG